MKKGLFAGCLFLVGVFVVFLLGSLGILFVSTGDSPIQILENIFRKATITIKNESGDTITDVALVYNIPRRTPQQENKEKVYHFGSIPDKEKKNISLSDDTPPHGTISYYLKGKAYSFGSGYITSGTPGDYTFEIYEDKIIFIYLTTKNEELRSKFTPKCNDPSTSSNEKTFKVVPFSHGFSSVISSTTTNENSEEKEP